MRRESLMQNVPCRLHSYVSYFSPWQSATSAATRPNCSSVAYRSVSPAMLSGYPRSQRSPRNPNPLRKTPLLAGVKVSQDSNYPSRRIAVMVVSVMTPVQRRCEQLRAEFAVATVRLDWAIGQEKENPANPSLARFVENCREECRILNAKITKIEI